MQVLSEDIDVDVVLQKEHGIWFPCVLAIFIVFFSIFIPPVFYETIRIDKPVLIMFSPLTERHDVIKRALPEDVRLVALGPSKNSVVVSAVTQAGIDNLNRIKSALIIKGAVAELCAPSSY